MDLVDNWAEPAMLPNKVASWLLRDDVRAKNKKKRSKKLNKKNKERNKEIKLDLFIKAICESKK